MRLGQTTMDGYNFYQNGKLIIKKSKIRKVFTHKSKWSYVHLLTNILEKDIIRVWPLQNIAPSYQIFILYKYLVLCLCFYSIFIYVLLLYLSIIFVKSRFIKYVFSFVWDTKISVFQVLSVFIWYNKSLYSNSQFSYFYLHPIGTLPLSHNSGHSP